MGAGQHTQEAPLMVAVQKPRRKPSSRHPFLTPPWGDDHPDFRRIDLSLPADHHARWLVQAVSHLDLSAVRRSYAGYGSLAFPVELLLPFVLFMYSQGILSPTVWHTHAKYDDQSKWLLKGLCPSRSQLYAFRDRLEPYLDSWHQQLLRWAVVEGITSACRGSLDGTFVAALASRHHLLSPRRIDRRLLLLRLLVWLEAGEPSGPRLGRLDRLPELVATAALLWLGSLLRGVQTPQLWDTLLGLLALIELLSPEAAPTGAAAATSPEAAPWRPRLPSWVPATPAGRQRVLKRYEDAQRRVAEKLRPYRDKHKLSKKDHAAVKRLKVSLTDPEAALGWDKNGTFRPLYNVPLVQATDAPLTLAWDVLPRNNDDGLLRPMMEKTKEQLGQHLQEALVDGAFVGVGDCVWCEQQGIKVYAPPSKAEAGKAEVARAEVGQSAGAKPAQAEAEAANAFGEKAAEPAAGQHSGGKKGEKLGKGAFRYDSVEKVYRCPQGKRLEEAYRTTEKRQNGMELPVIVHRAAGKDCQGCPQQKGCTSNPKKGRVVKRYEGEEALERLEKRMHEPASRKVYKLRCQSVELGYADIKEHRGLRVFRCFGRKRARVQAGLVILASNALKIMRSLHRRQSSQPPPSPKQPVLA
jgi:hypothetical protein